MSLKISVKTLLLTVAISIMSLTAAGAAQRLAPTAPPITDMLGIVGSDFIVVGERKFLVNSKTVITNKRGQKISTRLLKLKSKLQIEFEFIEKDGTNLPVANVIKVLSEP